MPIAAALEQVGGLQTQYAPSGYVGLWTRLADFQRDALTAALEDRSVIQATLLRTTIHMVSRREFWRYALGVRQARRDVGDPGLQDRMSEAEMRPKRRALRAALADGPKTVKELGELGGRVRREPRAVGRSRARPAVGTWERRRADRLALAETWVGPCDATEEEGLAHLVRAYLRAFGPAPWRDIATWAGISVAEPGGAGRAWLVRVSRRGRPRAHRPAGRAAARPGHAGAGPVPAPLGRRSCWSTRAGPGSCPRPTGRASSAPKNPFSVGTYLVDGVVAGAWSLRDGRVVLDPFEPLTPEDEARWNANARTSRPSTPDPAAALVPSRGRAHPLGGSP